MNTTSRGTVPQVPSAPEHAALILRSREYDAVLEHVDALRRAKHRAQVAKDALQVERLEDEFEVATTLLEVLREAEASHFVRGLRLAMMRSESQVRHHLSELVNGLVAEAMVPAVRRIGLVEDAVVDLSEGVTA